MLIILTIMIAVGCNNKQKSNQIVVPKEVLSAFKAKFSEVKSEKWEKEADKFEAEFKLNGKESSATFDVRGDLLETEQEIPKSELSKVITDYISTNYPNYETSEASKIELLDGNIRFEAELKNDKEKFDLIFDSSGKFLQKEK